MGVGESKPDYVKEETWKNFKKEELTLKKEKIKNFDEQLTEMKIKEHELTKNLMLKFVEYTQQCHDVPQWMMMFPKHREKCGLARAELIKEGLEYLQNSNHQFLKDKSINFVKSQFPFN